MVTSLHIVWAIRVVEAGVEGSLIHDLCSYRSLLSPTDLQIMMTTGRTIIPLLSGGGGLTVSRMSAVDTLDEDKQEVRRRQYHTAI